MRKFSKLIVGVVGLGLAACGVGKELDQGLDYGPEDAPLSSKDDSATSPASMARLTLGSVLKTSFTATGRWRALKFTATAGEKLDIFVDGLRGLDTVAYVYNVSATTGRPYSRPIATNDDTESPGWTVGSNTTANPQSSSIIGFVPRYSRDYAVVVTTYQQASRGTANVVVRPTQTALGNLSFVGAASGRFQTLAGVRFEGVDLSQAASDVVAATPSDWPTWAAAYRASPSALRAAVAAGKMDELVDAAHFNALGHEETFNSYVVATSPQRLGLTLTEIISHHVTDAAMAAPSWRVMRTNYLLLGAAMIADGFTHAFTSRMEESGDWSYVAVVAVNVDKGELRLLGFRRDP